MNPDSITKLTAGLFKDIDKLEDAKNYVAVPTPQKELEKKTYDSMNQIHMDLPVNSDKEEESPLYKFPEEQIQEFKKNGYDEFDDEYDEEIQNVEDEKFKKHEYDLLPEEKNPLKNFYNEIINEKAFDRLEPKKQKKMMKRRTELTYKEMSKDFEWIVKKTDSKVNTWLKNFKVFDYIIKNGKKYKVVGSKKQMDKDNKSTVPKLKYLEKLIKKSKFTEQVVKKFLEKYDFSPSQVTIHEIDTRIKPFYEKCIIKAFEKKIRYTRRV